MMKFIGKLVREPLLHFLLIGALLFVVFDLRQGEVVTAPDRIVIDRNQIGLMSKRFERVRLRPPTEAELQDLIEAQVREEIYYREALELGLDRNDPVVRQRMRTKMDSILEDLTSLKVDDAQLNAFLADNRERYRREAQISFRQVFLSADKHAQLDAVALKTLQQLQQGAAEDSLGDASLLPAYFSAADESTIERTFGAKFGSALFGLEPGDWQGPVYSPFGAHLVWIENKVDARPATLEEVREELQRDFLAQRRDQQKDIAYRRLRERYDIVIEPIPQSAQANSGTLPDNGSGEQ
jgi:parvulin-like peptidyl-prolyl isomerase